MYSPTEKWAAQSNPRLALAYIVVAVIFPHETGACFPCYYCYNQRAKIIPRISSSLKRWPEWAISATDDDPVASSKVNPEFVTDLKPYMEIALNIKQQTAIAVEQPRRMTKRQTVFVSALQGDTLVNCFWSYMYAQKKRTNLGHRVL